MMGRLVVAVALVLAALVAASALPAHPHDDAPAQFEVLGHLDPEGYAADVWGHRGYAYLSSYRNANDCPAHGVRVIDVRDPRRPRIVARFGSVSGTWTEKTIVRHVATPSFTGELAVTSMQSCQPVSGWHGFGLYDVTNPRQPKQLALVHTDPRGSHEIWLGTAGRRAFVYTAIIRSEFLSSPDLDPKRQTATKPGKPDFRIYDVSSPRRPVQVGGWGAWKHLDIHPNAGIGGGRQAANFVHSVITNAAGTRAYLSYWDLGTVILDISNPSQPRYLGRTRFEVNEVGNAHSAAVDPQETMLVETHETGGGTVTLWDIADAGSPKRLGEVQLNDQLLRQGRRGQEVERVQGLDLSDSVHDPKLDGQIAYFSWYRQGVVAADVSNPAEPRVIARFLPTPARDTGGILCPGSTCRAVWGVYVTSSAVLASDMLGGLWILRR
jgi:hypothetical protein